MTKTVRLETLIEKSHVKYSDFLGDEELEAFGVSNTDGITRTAHRKSDDLGNYLVIEPGSFAYNPYRINVGSIGLTPAGLSGVVSPAYIVFRAKEDKLIPEVLLDFLKSSEGLRQINKLARGAVRKALRYDDLCEIQFPEISYERQIAILKHKQGFNLNYSRLNQEISHQQNLLGKLKQAILQEAIQGKLTADWRAANPVSDLSTEASAKVEPASELLQRIQAEKARLIAEKKIRKEKPLPKITPEEIPFEIPDGWEWCRFGNLLKKYEAGKSFKCTDREVTGEEWGVLKTSSVTSSTFLERENKFFTTERPDDLKAQVKANDFLFCRASGSKGLAGTSVIVPECHRNLLLSDKTIRVEALGAISHQYIQIHNRSGATADYYSKLNSGKSTTMNNITKGQLTNKPIPLPPLAEQAAIVERVEALMATCRELEAEIERSRTHAADLLQAVLKEAFAPAS